MAIVLEKQREQEGMIAPRTVRDTANAPFADLLAEYVADLRAQERVEQHIHDTSWKIERVFTENGWKTVADVSASEFVAWRAKLTLSAKSKKEYLVSMNAFLNWLERQERLPANPLRKVTQVETRGKQVRQARAFTEEELGRLFAVSGDRALVYQNLLYTGQRKAEVKALRWADLRLEDKTPSAFFRASTTKDKDSRSVPLPEPLAAALRASQPEEGKRDTKVFLRFPHYQVFQIGRAHV